ncbi:AzlC family ABC transporter permease [Actinocorallia sp. A-T 12471]|uniref:AzlC family ABC transporter permease n=1 Tax=Actinocorallia sp. A-T 12471 TaxID=3089813 RepID=UPI0029CE46CB|nr:AzlC family ABC transporter permease [Actinocorallia sp. A-T 12471]MDX6739932.1 AzlC family ABC transporter permease [Actinocorallia sp. A-T 12471]
MDRGTLRDIGLVCVADALVGISFGALALAGGLPLWVPVALSVLVFAGGAQFAALGVVLAGGGAVTAVVTALVLNARLLPFGLAAADVFTGRPWRRLVGAHLLTDESLAFTLRHEDPRQRRMAFWVCGIALFVVWNLAVLVGAYAGSVLEDVNALGLDAAFPAVLLALVMPALTERGTRNLALLGTAVALAATPLLPPGVPVLLAPAAVAPLLLLKARRARTP